MWKIFKRDPLDIIDRRKTKAEKRHTQARRRAYRRRQRAESWQKFNKRVNEFISHPFAKKELTYLEVEKQRVRRHKKRDRKIARRKWWIKFKRNPWRIIIPRKKKRSPDGGYLYIYQMSKQERKELAAIKRKELIANFRKLITTPDLRQKFGFTFLHSTAYFILAFMLIYIIYQAVTIMVASSFNIPVVWYYYRLRFPLYTYSPLYTRSALVTIFAAGPIFSLMLAFVFLKLYFTTNVILKRFQLFYLWSFIAGCNMFFGAYIAGVITRTEFIYTSEWIFMSNKYDIEEIIFTSISFMMMLIIGRIATPLFLLSSGSVTMVSPSFRFFFILSQVIFPWMAGMVILFLITLPNYYIPMIIKTITPALILLPTLYLYDSLQYENIHKTGVIQRNYLRWSIIIAVIAILFFYRVLLNWGLKVS